MKVICPLLLFLQQRTINLTSQILVDSLMLFSFYHRNFIHVYHFFQIVHDLKSIKISKLIQSDKPEILLRLQFHVKFIRLMLSVMAARLS